MAKGWIRIDIERLVTWALRDQGLGWSGGEQFSKMAEMAQLGTVIDTSPGGSHPSIGLWSHDDALLVKQAVDGLAPRAAALVMRFGRTALRPEWGEEGEGGYEQDIDAAGRLRWDWADPVNRTGERTPRLVFVGTDPRLIDAERAEYLVWWQGLADIVAPLNLVLTEHMATGPAAPREPWTLARPVVHGAGERAEAPVRVYDERPSDRVARAQAPVRSVARDWGTENSVLNRTESAAGKGGARGA